MNSLAGLKEVEEILGVSQRTAARYVKRQDFPQPIDRVASGPIWFRSDVERWGRAYLPLPRREPMKGRLAGMAELAEILGSTWAAGRYSQRADFPQPTDRLAASPIWRREDVEKWARDHLPLLRGRPRRGSDG